MTKNQPSLKEYSPISSICYEIDYYIEEQTELLHYRFPECETQPCVLLKWERKGANDICTIRGSEGTEDVNSLSLYVKKEDVPPMPVNKPKT